MSSGVHLDLLQTIVSNLKDVGIDMEMRLMDSTAYRGVTAAMKQEQTVFHCSVGAVPFPPDRATQKFYLPNPQNYGIAKDPVLDGSLNNYGASITEQEQRERSVKASDHVVAHRWAVFLPPRCPMS
jgi:hypothetical protein